jgi:hypothetical protein
MDHRLHTIRKDGLEHLNITNLVESRWKATELLNIDAEAAIRFLTIAVNKSQTGVVDSLLQIGLFDNVSTLPFP